MEDRAPTTNLTQCLSPAELNTFIERVGLDWDIGTALGGLPAIIVHARAGDVAWVWMENISAFCWKIPGLPI